ncbi:CsbD family protein [Streptomyces sp. ICBB 8177]|uniref:CsbD family protein n=1 Tax=Streptomyces sp. ICBB 8177 TaxID=563922 RepID=UPI000D68354F|nr:CsbD family protein [Streptomyces sp. ICBB 8177]PWI44807.1 general stress protein CsbD [Streptomyces sp. ICBB 8177]
MSARDKARNSAGKAKGKAKEIAGRAVGDEELEVEGQAEQARGDLKQAAEHVKDALKR